MGQAWELTPRQAQTVIDAHADRQRDQLDRDVALAWHTARFMRGKRLRSLRSYLQRARRRRDGEPPAPPTQAERAQIVTAAQAFAAKLRNRKQGPQGR